MRASRYKVRQENKAQQRSETRVSEGIELRRSIEGAARGDVTAFGELYSIYLDRIYRYVFYQVKDKMTAEDLTEDIFVKAWGAIDRYKGEGQTFSAWLYRIAHNHVIDYFRTRRQYSSLETETAADGNATEQEAEGNLMHQELGEEVIGVIEVLNKADGSEFNRQELKVLTALASMAALAIDAKLHQSVLDGYVNTIKVLAASIDAKDPYTHGHSQRVTKYALLGGASLSLPPEELKNIEYGGILHDIGKIAVDEAILRKPGPLTPEEWEVMRTHPTVGANIIADVPFLEEPRKLVLHHHEKYDGTGYPDRLKGEDIPLGARLLAVADALDTMLTERSYRGAASMDHALSELRRCTGTHFCPVAVEASISGLNKRREIID